MKFITNSVTIG